MLPSRKRYPAVSASEIAYTGEIEVVSDRVPPSTRRPVDRRPISYPRLPTPRPPSEIRHCTMVPPSVPAYPAELAESDDDMTVLWAERPRAFGTPPSSRRRTPVSFPPQPAAALRYSAALEYESRLAVTGPASRRSDPPEAPDSLRPVAMAASLSADASGPHEPQPTSFTMRTQLLPGRPTLAWAGALVVIGVLVGLGTSLLTQAGIGAEAASAPSTAMAGLAAAAQPPQAPPVAENRAPEVAPPKPSAAPGEWVAAPPAPVASSAATSAPGPLAALTGAKGDGDSTPHASERPTYVAPPSHAAPVHRWVAPPKPAAPPVAPVSTSVAATDSFPPPPATPPSWKANAKSKTKRGADADLQAASASDALARAQLEAALR